MDTPETRQCEDESREVELGYCLERACKSTECLNCMKEYFNEIDGNIPGRVHNVPAADQLA